MHCFAYNFVWEVWLDRWGIIEPFMEVNSKQGYIIMSGYSGIPQVVSRFRAGIEGIDDLCVGHVPKMV